MENISQELTLETLPKAFSYLTNEVGEIKRILLEKHNENEAIGECWLNLSQLCNYHPDCPSKQTVYRWVSLRTIPVHKSGKKLRFLKSEIDNWLKLGRRRTNTEISASADYFCNSKKG